MVEITKEEAMKIREEFPRAYIIRTMKQHSSRGKFYLDESSASQYALAKVREEGAANDERA